MKNRLVCTHGTVKMIFKWKPIGNGAVGRSKPRWGHDVITHLKKMRITDLIAVETEQSEKRLLRRGRPAAWLSGNVVAY